MSRFCFLGISNDKAVQYILRYQSILSQINNATVFYFNTISCVKPIISPKRRFSESSILPYNGFNNLFRTVKKTNRFMEVGWLKKKMKGMVMYQYPTREMHFVHRKR